MTPAEPARRRLELDDLTPTAEDHALWADLRATGRALVGVFGLAALTGWLL